MIALLAAAASAEEVWVVPDETLAEALRGAIAEEWPEVDHVVRVGPVPPLVGQQVWSWDGARLTLLDDEGREGEAGDPHVAALLARTWAIRAETPSFERWAPTPAPMMSLELEPTEATSAPGWSLVVALGARGATGEPGLVQGARLSPSATLGVVLWTADLYAGLWPAARLTGSGPFASHGRFDDARIDRTTLGSSLGLRSLGGAFAQATVGGEWRVVEHVLDRSGIEVSSYTSTNVAVPVRAGVGLRRGRLVPVVSGVARVTPGLPATVGVELDLGLEVARDRRERVGDGGKRG